MQGNRHIRFLIIVRGYFVPPRLKIYQTDRRLFHEPLKVRVTGLQIYAFTDGFKLHSIV